MNLILKFVRGTFYLCLPFLITFYGAVTKTVYTTLFVVTTVITILCLIYWFTRKELPAFSKKTVIPLLILFAMIILQILSSLFVYTASGSNYHLNKFSSLFPFSADIYSTIQSFAKASTYLCILFCFLTAFQSYRHKYHFLLFFCFTGFAISFFAIIKMMLQQLGLFTLTFYKEGFGPYINRNHYAGYINMVIPACWALIAISLEKSKKILGLFFVTITASSLFLSLSRGGILSFFISGIFTFLFLYIRKDESRRNRRVFQFIGLMCVFLFLWWIGIDPVLRRLSSVFNFPDEPSFTIRLWWSLDSIGIMKDYPLFGTGLGTLEYVFNAYKTDAHQYLVNYLHNDYFQFITECGISGFLILLFCAYHYFKTSFSQIKQAQPDKNHHYLSICSLSAAVALGVHSFVDFNLHIPANSICFLLTLSLPFNINEHTTAKESLKIKNYIPFFILVIIQLSGTITSIDILRYESSLDKALAHSEFVFKQEALTDVTKNRTCYSKGFHELGKAQFYEGHRTSNTELLASSVANFEKAIKREPRNTEYYLRVGVARYLVGNRQNDVITAGNMSNRALSDLHHAVKLDRTNGMMWFFYGSYLVKNWYDFWNKDDEQLRKGIDALSAAVSFRPSYLPGCFEKIVTIDNKYVTLNRLLHTVTSVKMLKKERLKRLATLHSLFSKQLKKHIAEIDFGTHSKTELLYSNDLVNQADASMKLSNFEKALLLYEKVTKLPGSDENKIKAHAGIAASCLAMLRAKNH